MVTVCVCLRETKWNHVEPAATILVEGLSHEPLTCSLSEFLAEHDWVAPQVFSGSNENLNRWLVEEYDMSLHCAETG